MIRKAVSALTGLGLIGGAGTVAYNQHGDATVKIKDKNGSIRTVLIKSDGGMRYSCPAGTHDKLMSFDIQAGRIKLTMRDVRREESKLDNLYPSHKAPHKVVIRYNALLRRDHRLVAAYNAEVDAHNAVLGRDCTPG
jgi:hypothetical protein